jgi:hypothetical protein
VVLQGRCASSQACLSLLWLRVSLSREGNRRSAVKSMNKQASRLNAKQRHEGSKGEKMVDWGELGSLVSERDRRPDAHSDLTSSKLRRCREHRPIAHHRPPSATLGSFRSRRVFCLATPDDKHQHHTTGQRARPAR